MSPAGTTELPYTALARTGPDGRKFPALALMSSLANNNLSVVAGRRSLVAVQDSNLDLGAPGLPFSRVPQGLCVTSALRASRDSPYGKSTWLLIPRA